jgi:hypothetical protein
VLVLLVLLVLVLLVLLLLVLLLLLSSECVIRLGAVCEGTASAARVYVHSPATPSARADACILRRHYLCCTSAPVARCRTNLSRDCFRRLVLCDREDPRRPLGMSHGGPTHAERRGAAARTDRRR